jgi:hypothetical protein
LLKVGTALAYGIIFMHNQVLGSPDSVITGTNLSQVVYRDNLSNDHSTFNVPPTSGITTQLSPAATLDIGGAHTVGLNPSPTPIATIQSSLGPGEMITFFMLSGTATFNSGGNINLAGGNSVTINGSITFVRNDLTGPLQAWTPVAQWNAGASTTTVGFAIAASPPSASILAGDSSTFDLTVAPTGGFSGAVQFICTGAPLKSACSVSPNPLTVTGTSPASATVTVTTTAASAQAAGFNRRDVPFRRALSSFGSLAVGLILGIIPVSSGQRAHSRKKRRLLPCLLLVLASCLGCGGTVAASTPPLPPVQPGTPQGIYTLKITGVSGNTDQSTTIILTVQ